MAWRLWLGVFVLFLAFWKGDGGYLDLQEQLVDAKNLWTYGNLQLRTPEGVPLEPPQYNRYATGLAIFSGPMVLIGRVLGAIFGDVVNQYALIALFVPLVGAFGAVFLYRLARGLNASNRVAVFTVLIFTTGGLLLSQTRFFYAEVPLTVCVLAALAWTLEAKCEQSIQKALFAGAALGAGTLFHVAAIVLTAPLAVLLALYLWANGRNWRYAFSVLALLAAGVCVVFLLNTWRYGSPLNSEYDSHHSIGRDLLAIQLLPQQIEFLGQMLLRVAWLVPATVFLFVAALNSKEWLLFSGVGVLLLLQWFFWTTFGGLTMFPVRYFGPCLALAAVGLCLLLKWLERMGTRSLMYSTVLLVSVGLLMILRGDDGQPPLVPDGSGGLHGNFWFAPPQTPRALDAPLGAAQWFAFSGLLLISTALLRSAYRLGGTETSVRD